MPFIPVANGVQLVVELESNTGAQANLVLGVRFMLPAVLGTLATFAASVADFFGGEAVRPWSSGWAVTGTHEYGLDTADAPTFTDHAGTIANPYPISGTHTGTRMSDQVAVVNTLQTGMRGRSQHGRNYWPGVSEADLDGYSDLFPIVVEQWNTFMADFIENMVLAETPLVVISRYSGGTPRLAGVMTNVVDNRCEHKLGTQRRRLMGTFGG